MNGRCVKVSWYEARHPIEIDDYHVALPRIFLFCVTEANQDVINPMIVSKQPYSKERCVLWSFADTPDKNNRCDMV